MRYYGLLPKIFVMNDNFAQNYTVFYSTQEWNHIFKRHNIIFRQIDIYSNYLACDVAYWKIIFFIRIQFSILPWIFLWRKISLWVWLTRHWDLKMSFSTTFPKMYIHPTALQRIGKGSITFAKRPLVASLWLLTSKNSDG